MYLFAIVFLSFLAFLEVFNKEWVEKNKALLIFVSYAFLVFHDGFRWETGCDWKAYSTYFENLFTDYSFSDPGFEIGYFMLQASIRFFTDNYSVYLVIHALIFYALIYYVVFKLSISPFVSILMLYMVTVPFMGTNRQLLALAILSLGLYFLVKGRKSIFLLLVLLSLFFHSSAMLCLVALLANLKIKKIYYVGFIVLAILISMSGIVNDLSPLMLLILKDDTLSEKLEYYTNITNQVAVLSSILSIVRKSIWIVLLLFLDNRIENKPKSYNFFFNLYFLGLFFYIVFNGTVFQIFVSRALMYFNIAEIFIVPYVLLLFKPDYGKLAVMFVLSLYVYINVEKGFSNYGENNDFFEPYKGVFINTGYVKQSI